MKFVSLHHHTTFSYQDGYGTPAQHVERAAELDMPALAFTEHGNVSSHPQAEKAAQKAGIKPIFGVEAYTHPDPDSNRKFHLTILASDQEGYRNLMRLVTRSWAENFYRWPTVNGQMLRDHNEGLIVLSGCSDSLLACSLLGGKTIAPEEASYARAKAQALAFKRLLGDRFYLECQAFPELPRTQDINTAYERLGTELGVPLVATADVHYPHPDDNEMQKILHAAGRGNNTIAQQAETWEYNIRLTHPPSDKDIYERMRGTGLSRLAAQAACRASAEIAERCNVTLPKAANIQFPVASVAPGLSSEELIWKWMREGWTYRIKQGNTRLRTHKQDYINQLQREMKEIKNKGFIDYMLMTSDAVRFAKDAGIPVGPARGSAAASLVCYLLRITEIDPLQYPLMYFERFIDPTRTDFPDIDLDFDGARRHEIREHLVRRWGAGCVGNIANYVKYKGKNSIDDVARVYRIPDWETKTVKNMIVDRSTGDSRADFSLQDTIEMFPSAKAVFDKHPDLWKATRLEGNYKGMSVHAGGLVVSSGPISNVCALYARTVKGHPVEVVSVDKYDAEYLNLLKADFLGLDAMNMVSNALRLAGLTLEDMYRVRMDDPEVLNAFRRNDVVGIFQFEGRATRLVNRDVKPDNFMELADVNALSRPGPLFSGTTADYIDVKRGKKNPIHWHPIVDQLTAPSKFQIIYQEQILLTLERLGGLPVGKVHHIRRIISKKLGEAEFNKSADDFAQGCMELHGLDRETALGVWARLVTSATYAFNVAHCISYSMLGVWCMWLKMHYPLAFYAATLMASKEEGWGPLVKDAERHGIPVRGVIPGRSRRGWDIDGNEVIAGWEQLKGVGQAKADAILAYHAESPIQTFSDLINVRGIGPKSIEKFRSQMEGDDPFGLKRIARSLDAVRAGIESGELPVPAATCRSDDILDIPGDTMVVWLGIPHLKEYKDVFEDERARTGKDVEEIKREIKRPDLPTSCVLHCRDDGDEDVYVRITRFDYPRFASALERLVAGHDVVWVYARRSNNSFGASLYVQDLVVIDPDDD